MTRLRQIGLLVMVELILAQPVLTFVRLPQVVQAAAGQTVSTTTQDCATDYSDDEDLGPPSFSLDNALLNPYYKALFNQESFNAYVNENGGWLDNESGLYFFCSQDAADKAGSLGIFNLGSQDYLDALTSDVGSRITFKNQIDKYALTGEPCTKFLGDVCDPTTQRQPVYLTDPVTGQQAKGSDGKPIQKQNADGSPMYADKPLYYDDSIWPNGHWDAPKADVRVLQTLIYLVTPTDQGGAGREHIKVGKIIQSSSNNTEFDDGDAAETAGLNDESKSAAAVSSRGACGPAHYYDATNPEHPACVSQALDIDEVDTLRVTTKITKKKRLGGSSTSYQFQSFPIKVAWQTSEGIDKSGGLPVVDDMFGSARLAVTNSFLQLLDEYDFGTDIDPSQTDIKSLGDLANALGESFIGQLLNSPSGSLTGWDLTSTLNNLGRSYLASQLGLVPGALSDTDGDMVENIGRATLEYNLGLAAGSLKGATGDAIYAAAGRRYLETTILGIAPGSLDGTASASLADRLLRIGAGALEQKLSLKPGVTATASSITDLLGKLTAANRDALSADNASTVDEELGLSFIDAGDGKDRFGNPSSSYADATKRLLAGSLSLDGYLRVVGASTVSSGIGSFSAKAASASFDGSNPFSGDAGSIYASLMGNNAAGLAAMVASGALTAQEGASLGARLNQAKADYSYAGGDTGRLQSLYNQIADPDTGWLGLFGTAQGRLKGTDGTCSDAQAGTDAATACGIAGRAVSQLSSYQDAVLSYYRQQGQSGQGAATNLSGTTVSFDPAGRITGVSVGQDPLAAFLGDGSFSYGDIGRQVVAGKLSGSLATGMALASQLTPDTSPAFQTLSGVTEAEGQLAAAGIRDGDLQRIFQKGLGDQVFTRIGQQELLRTTWGEAAIPATLSATATASRTASSLAASGSAPTDTAFYADTYSRLQLLVGNLSKAVSGAAGTNGAAARQQVAAIQALPAATTPEAMLANVKEASVRISLITGLLGSGAGVSTPAQAAQHLINELVAGRDLSVGTTSATPASTSTNYAGCWNAQAVASVVRQNAVIGQDADGDGLADGAEAAGASRRQAQLGALAGAVASCQLDGALNLPSGSVKGWAATGDTSATALAAAIGKAAAASSGTGITTQSAVTAGTPLLAQAASGLLGSLIPGYGRPSGLTDITPADLVSLVSGNAGAILRLVGEASLDTTLSWPRGTAATLISPSCYSLVAASYVSRECSSQERTDIRMNGLAKLGMQELGLQLNLPGSFDVTGSGGITASFGRALASSLLGLAANSFSGSFSSVINENDPLTLADSLGLDGTPFTRQADLLRAVAASKGTDATYQNAVTLIDAYLGKAGSNRLASVGDPSSPYWNGTDGSALAALIGKDRSAFSSLLGALPPDLRSLVSGSDLSDAAVTQAYAAAIGDFQSRSGTLGGQFGGADLKAFITGKVSAESLLSDWGQAQLKSKLDKGTVNGILASMDPSEASIIGTMFTQQRVGTDPVLGTPQTCSVFDMLTSKGGICGLANDQDLLTSGDPKAKLFRSDIYDGLLAQTFGGKLSSITGMPASTLRNMVMDPAKAPQLALQEGISQVAASIFTAGSGDSYASAAEGALKSAFMASFEQGVSCDPSDYAQFKRLNQDGGVSCYRYGLNLSADRGIDALKSALTTERNLVLSQEGSQFFGLPITPSDVTGILSGNMDTVSYLAEQKLASSINLGLSQTNDARAGSFKLDYFDVRAATGTLTTAELNQIGTIASLKARTALAAQPGTHTEQQLKDAGTQAYNDAVVDAAGSSKADAQKSLQYKMYDALAFKTDANIPAGFAKAMLAGSDADKEKAIGSYAFNALGLAKDLGGITLTDADTLSSLAQNGFNPDAVCSDKGLDAAACTALKGDITGTIIPRLQGFVSSRLGSFGLPNLPQGALVGFAAWAKAGFSADSFNDGKLSFAGQTVPSLGAAMQNFGLADLLSWSDSMLGFQPGQSFQIYKAYRAYADAAKALKDAKLAGDTAKAQAAQGAKAQAEAALVTVAVNAVFEKQFAALDERFGLVPGTTSGLVGAGISYLFGVGNPLVTLGLLVAMNLFGVYKVVVKVEGGANGIYPLDPPADTTPYEYPAPAADGTVPDFNAKNPSAYRAGIMQAAQAKVHGLLRDLLVMPEQWGTQTGTDPKKLWISQAFSDPAGDLGGLNVYTSANAPWESPAGYGYGALGTRTTGSASTKNGIPVLAPVSGYNAGFFPDPNFWNHVHVRW